MSKPKEADVWMPLYIGRYRRKTARLTRDQHGAYFLLLLDYWVNGAPPDDDRVLATLTLATAAEWKKLRPVLLPFFAVMDGRWTNERSDIERAKAKNNTEQKSTAGKASGASRRQRKVNGDGTDVQRHGQRQANDNINETRNHHQTDSSEANASDGLTPVASDLKSQVFGPVLQTVMRLSKKPEDKCRTWLGKLCSAYGDGATIEAVTLAERNSPLDLIPYVTEVLKKRGKDEKSRGDLGLSKGQQFARAAAQAVLSVSDADERPSGTEGTG